MKLKCGKNKNVVVLSVYCDMLVKFMMIKFRLKLFIVVWRGFFNIVGWVLFKDMIKVFMK